MNASLIYNSALLICVLSAIAAELVSLAVPEKILGMADIEPGVLFESLFYKAMLFFSGLYILAVLFMFISNIPPFRMYALVLVGLSLISFIFRSLLLKIRIIQIAESIICLIILIDTVRVLLRLFPHANI